MVSSQSNLHWKRLAHHTDFMFSSRISLLHDKSSERMRRFRQRTRDALVAFVGIMAVDDSLEIGSTDSQASICFL
jgi:hypothetical protein